MNKRKPFITALIVAAGNGERFGGDVPKQYMPLLGKPVLRRSIDAFINHPLISDILVVINAAHKDLYRDAVQGLRLPPPVIGGKTRQESARKGLKKIGKNGYVLIHDAARPLVSAELITALCTRLKKEDAVIPALPVTDTLKRRTGKKTITESRDNLWAVQTPQGFKSALIGKLHEKFSGESCTDDAALCEKAGVDFSFVTGDRKNIKVTHAEDLALAEEYLAGRLGDIRTGTGYDVHRLVSPANATRKLMLCGIEVRHAKVLEGHSDADVALHAITDALLATICDGDIGLHFSPKDARWKNADSAQFLKHAAELVHAQGGVISHIDATIICEAPKISPHRDAMRQRIAAILGLPVSRVSLKATTTEGLGFTGRGEGIAAEAVATVRLPFGARKKGEEKWAI